MSIFIDTWGWLSLYDGRETMHTEVGNIYRTFRQKRSPIYSSDYVLDETITLLFRRLPFESAINSFEVIQQAIDAGYLQLERITPDRFNKAVMLRKRYQDKPLISFTDLTPMVVMDELRIGTVLTGDEHFVQVGMGFQKVP